MSEKEKKDIAEMVKTAKYLAKKNDPQGFMLARNTVDVLKARADMDVKVETGSNKEE